MEILQGIRGFREKGLSLVEVVVASALLLLMFVGVIGAFQTALVLTGHARAQSGAVSLANERLEYIRSLPYVSVGTVGGIPSGSIPQNETLLLNGVSYNRRTFIRYEDSPDDGLGAADTNTITADYKVAKVELSWTVKGTTRSIILVTNIIPQGIETLAGGGTLVVNVFDAAALPVDNASVHVVNASTTPPIDVLSDTNPSGVVMFPGAPASAGYQITAFKTGYSTAQTYSSSSTNPNPNPAHVAVVASLVSTVNFAIDKTSSRVIRTVAPPTADKTEDLLSNTTYLAASSSVVVGGGEMVLTGAPGTYSAQGSATTTTITPASLYSWTNLSWNATVPASTTLRMRMYSVNASNTVYTLIPDADLPLNSAGFATSPVNLSALSLATYPRLAVVMSLQSLTGSDTPHVLDWKVSYLVSDVPIASIVVGIKGAKNIGTDGVGQPVPKYTKSINTGASGSVIVSPLEWDQYTTTVNGATGYDISDICTTASLSVAPDTLATTTLVLSSHTPNSLLVRVESPARVPISGATVSLTSGGAPSMQTTSSCGYAYFGGLSSSASSTISTSAGGYTTDVLFGIAISGTTQLNVTLSP